MQINNDRRYRLLIERLKEVREKAGLTEAILAQRLGGIWSRDEIVLAEACERRLGPVELFDWLQALEVDPSTFLREMGWFGKVSEIPGERYRETGAETLPAVPIAAEADDSGNGVIQHLFWQNTVFKIRLAGTTIDAYTTIENEITHL